MTPRYRGRGLQGWYKGPRNESRSDMGQGERTRSGHAAQASPPQRGLKDVPATGTCGARQRGWQGRPAPQWEPAAAEECYLQQPISQGAHKGGPGGSDLTWPNFFRFRRFRAPLLYVRQQSGWALNFQNFAHANASAYRNLYRGKKKSTHEGATLSPTRLDFHQVERATLS